MKFEKRQDDVSKVKHARKALPRIKELKNTWQTRIAQGAGAAQKQQVPPPTYDNTSLFG